MDPQIDPKELPEYLQPLMKGLADGLSIHQWEELAEVIYESRDVFNKGPTDMGQTGLVKHTINTRDTRPI